MHVNEWGSLLHGYWAEFSWVVALMVFLAYIVLDILYALYTLAVNRLQPARAATTGSLMYFLLALGVFSYTHNPLYVISLVLGSWIGTYVAVLHELKKKQRNTPP